MTKKIDDDTGHYEGALLEDILDRVKGIAEGQLSLWDKVDAIDKRLINVEENTSLIPVIRAAVTDQMRDLNSHNRRITILEHAKP
jgi:hypothetical protein